MCFELVWESACFYVYFPELDFFAFPKIRDKRDVFVCSEVTQLMYTKEEIASSHDRYLIRIAIASRDTFLAWF